MSLGPGFSLPRGVLAPARKEVARSVTKQPAAKSRITSLCSTQQGPGVSHARPRAGVAAAACEGRGQAPAIAFSRAMNLGPPRLYGSRWLSIRVEAGKTQAPRP